MMNNADWGNLMPKLSYFAKVSFLLVAILPVAACAQSSIRISKRNGTVFSDNQNTECQISIQDREALLNLDYNSFDQSLPDGGWRKYQLCPLLTRELLDDYITKHQATLQKQEWDVLVWHSGQISAMAGDYTDAISKMKKTFKPMEKPTDAFLWNPYAKASIAFLEKDKARLLAERKKLTRGLSPFNRLNLRHVDAFIRCFESSYQAAYSISGCKPGETNIERIRSLAVPLELTKPLPKDFFSITDFFKMKKVILVGEIHGTKTTPELFGQIVSAVVDEKTKTLVILEINQTSQPSIDEFIKTGDEAALKKDPFFSRTYQDGRSSQAMVALLKKLVKLPNTTVLCMDPMDGILTMTGQQRDTGMANFINSKRIGYDHTLVLSGNIHSSTTIGTPWDKAYRPMGYELKNLAKDLTSDQLFNILVRYGKVDSWNCQGADASSCSAHYGKQNPTDYSNAVNYPAYFVWENELTDGHAGTIFIRQAKISLPYVQF